MDKKELIDYFKQDLFATQLCGIEIDEVSQDGACCSMVVRAEHLNAQGTVQGGAIFTLADFTFAVAANAGGVPTVSLNAQINFLRPGKGERLTARAVAVHSGRQVCLYNIKVYDDQEKLCADMNVQGFRKTSG